jgi:signal transduction histidine kinase
VGRSTWAAWAVDATAAGVATGLLMTIGDDFFGPAYEPETTVTQVCTWAATGAAVLALAIAVVGRHPPRATGAGFVALALIAPGVASVGTAPAWLRIIAVVAGSALALAIARFTDAVLGARSRVADVALAVATIVALTVRLLFRDPFRELRCAPYCGDNPLLLAARPQWVTTADRVLAAVTVCWSVAAAVLIVRTRPSTWVRTTSALAVAAAAIFAVTWWAQPGLTIWGDPTQRVTIVPPLLLTVALLLATYPDVQAWRTRRQVRKLATDLATGHSSGGVAGHLQQVLRDGSVRFLFPLATDGYLDVAGHGAARDPQLTATTIERDGQAVALVEHQPESSGLLRATLTPAVTIVVENERLRALALAELDELRASRRRIVERADETRRRLERDLHDGAQQRLLLLGMQLARAAATAPPSERNRYVDAIRHTQDALDELRTLVHERLPPVLHELGLVEALRSLAETAPIPVLIEDDLPAGHRPAIGIERALYGLAVSVIAGGAARGASKATIFVGERSGRLTATVTRDGTGPIDPTDDEDRIGAAGGSLAVTIATNDVEYVASFP